MNGEHYIVSGPGTEGRNAPSLGSGLSLAQTLASRAPVEGTWYVRNPAGAIDYHVTRTGTGTVVTARPATVEPTTEARQPAEAQTMKEAIA